jgi:hypothetical protein
MDSEGTALEQLFRCIRQIQPIILKIGSSSTLVGNRNDE